MLPRPNASEACSTAMALEHAAHRSSSMPEGAGGLAHTVRATAASVGASLSGVVGRAETFDALRKRSASMLVDFQKINDRKKLELELALQQQDELADRVAQAMRSMKTAYHQKSG